MNMEKLTQKSQETIVQSQEMALRLGHQQMDIEHLHYALLANEESLVAKLLAMMGKNVSSILIDLGSYLDKLPKVQGESVSSVYPSRRFNEVLIKAQDEAKTFQDEYISVEHIYLAILDKNQGYSKDIISKYHLN